MFRNAYRRFADHDAIVLTHTIKGANAPAVLRWYEIRDPGATPTLHQQGTFSPDTRSRWMGSIATDSAGNIAVGYSIGSSSMHPSISIAARTPDMALGTLGNETIVFDGPASQQGTSRWGDYSQLTVDPADECTFWYTAEYVRAQTPKRHSRIVAFTLPNCTH